MNAEMVKVYGYTNAETAAMILDIDNTRERQEYWLDRARAARASARRGGPPGALTRKQVAVQSLADALEEEVTDARPEATDGADIYASLLTIALERVEWREVAEHLLDKQAEIAAQKK